MLNQPVIPTSRQGVYGQIKQLNTLMIINQSGWKY